jgi:hypothetical protein
MSSKGSPGVNLPPAARERLSAALLRHGLDRCAFVAGVTDLSLARAAIGLGVRTGTKLAIMAAFSEFDDLDRLDSK